MRTVESHQQHRRSNEIASDAEIAQKLRDAERYAQETGWRPRPLPSPKVERGEVRRLGRQHLEWLQASIAAGQYVTTAEAREFAKQQARRSCTPRRGARQRGAGRPARRSGSSSATSSSDPGDSDPDAEAEPPARLCACGCRQPLTGLAPQARYLDAAHKQAAHRRRSAAAAERVDGDDPYLRFPKLGEAGADYDELVRRAQGGCRCNGWHVLLDSSGDCFMCGRPYRGAPRDLREAARLRAVIA